MESKRIISESEEQIKYLSPRKLLGWGIVILIALSAIVAFLPLAITKWSWMPLGVDHPNEIGDTIGGILGPSVGLVTTALTFLAFWAQYDANIEQRRQFREALKKERLKNTEDKKAQALEQERQTAALAEEQRQFAEAQRLQQEQIASQELQARTNLFETRFYTMLSIHRENASNIEVNKTKGRKVFMEMLTELKFFYEVFNAWYDNDEEKYGDLRDDQIFNIAYLSFFFGVGEKSTPMVIDLVPQSHTMFTTDAHKLISTALARAKSEKLDSSKNKEKISITIGGRTFEWNRVYTLGVGHLRRLSHYVRHLYQIVKFVDDQPDEFLSTEKKYDYITNLRSQLSVHEQILLYYNALSVLGQPWFETTEKKPENFIEKYCMLKSMPLNAPDFYKSPEDVLPAFNNAGKPMFEWIEIQTRMVKLFS